MNSELIVPMIIRWVHIACAMLAIGAPFFVRFGLMPAASTTLDEAAHQKLREAIAARWRIVVYVMITLFILTGLYNFLVETRVDGVLITARWKDFSPEDRRLYHMIFGIKMLAALGLFTLASALCGRTRTFEAVRRNARLYITILLILGAIILACSTGLRFLHAPASPPVASPH